jgi:hypothetical protein
MSCSTDNSDLDTVEARIGQARRLYEQGNMSVRAISERCGLTKSGLYGAAKRQGWSMRASPFDGQGKQPDRALAKRAKAWTAPSPDDRRRALVGRAWALAEAQMAGLERRMRRLEAGDAPASQSERDARAMACLVRALKELTVLDGLGATGSLDGEDQKDSEAKGDFPRDVDQLKNELTRHLEGLRRERAGKAAAGDPSA